MEKHYNIMTSCDNTLAPYVAVGLTAMAFNLENAGVNFFFLHSKVSQKNIELLKALCEKLEGGKIHFHEIVVPDAKIYDELARYGHGWGGEAFYSLCAHLLLPDDIDRVLYLDAGDTLVLGDIEPYYSYDFQNKSLTATCGRFKWCGGKLELLTSDDLGNVKEMLPGILRGIFNSGSYVMNLERMREDKRTLADYLYLLSVLKDIFGEDNHQIYWGDQGLLSAAFVGDIRYYGFPEIRNLWYMPFNFCTWYYDQMTEEPDYSPAILHFTGTPFKPWDGIYPGFLKRFQNRERMRSLKELRVGQAGYFYLWYEYAVIADRILGRL